MNLGTFFSELVSEIKADEKAVLLPLAAAAAVSLAANPTKANAVAQGAKLLVDAVAAQPTIGQQALVSIAAEVSALATSLDTPAKPAPVAAAPAVAHAAGPVAHAPVQLPP
jgi:hypothetical protein